MSVSEPIVDIVDLTSIIGPLALDNVQFESALTSLLGFDSLDQAHDELDTGSFGLLNSTIQQC